MYLVNSKIFNNYYTKLAAGIYLGENLNVTIKNTILNEN